uniref:Uncharacterized protein n=2 Tax=Pseudomonadaceae TaxID=135621 RepID=B7XGV1_PSEPU|nr:hypothetical protein [Pseudomonas resinovorans]BAH10109.1 hypothetical protein [Pseudomonas putida]
MTATSPPAGDRQPGHPNGKLASSGVSRILTGKRRIGEPSCLLKSYATTGIQLTVRAYKYCWRSQSLPATSRFTPESAMAFPQRG